MMTNEELTKAFNTIFNLDEIVSYEINRERLAMQGMPIKDGGRHMVLFQHKKKMFDFIKKVRTEHEETPTKLLSRDEQAAENIKNGFVSNRFKIIVGKDGINIKRDDMAM